MKIFKLIVMVFTLISNPVYSAIINVDSGATGCTLHDAIRAANTNMAVGGCTAGSNTSTPDNIVLPDTFSLVLNSDLPTVTSQLTIRTATPSGQATINGDYSYRCLHFQGVQNVTLENIILLNGQTTQGATNVNISDTGSGILVQNSELTLENVSILSNSADAGFGAGIAAYSSNLNLNNVNFIGNKFTGYTGIYGLGAHLYVRQSTVNINNSTFESFIPYPNVVAANGSAIFIAGSNVEISGTTFRNNPTLYYGATISIQDLLSDPVVGASNYDNASLLIKNSTFANTQAWFSGDTTVAAIVAAKESSDKNVNVTLRNVTMYKSGLDISTTPDTFSATQISIYPQVNFSSSNSLFVFGQNYNSCFASFDNANWSVDINNSFPDDACNFTTTGGNPTTNYTLYGNLQDNGGLTETIKLRPLDFSFTPAIENLAFNAGDTATCEPYDQRGILRQMPCEQGAYEVDDVADIGVQVQLMTQGPYYFGQTLKYQISVSNDGPAIAYGVDLSLTTNTITLVEYDSVYSCSGNSCQIIFIPNNGSAEITLYAQINNVQNFDLGATVDFASNSISDINLANNTDTSNNGGTTVNASDLEITQTLNTPPPYYINQVLEYSITVNNLGNSQAQNISISHPVLDGINAVSHSNCDSSNANTCSISTLNNGSSRTVLFNAQVVANKIENQTEVTSSVYDPKLRNNTATNRNSVATKSNLKMAVSKLTAAPHFQAQSLQFTVDILNSGPDPASNVTIDNTYDNTVVIGVSNQCNNILPCVIPSIAVNETVSILYTSTLFTEDFSINSFVTADQNDFDFFDNVDGFSGSIVNDSDVLIGINLISQPPYYRNSTIDLELVIANYGSHDASDVNISISNLNNLQVSHVESENCAALPCNIVALSSLSNATIQIQAFIPNIGDFSITANVNASEYDPILNNNQSSFTETALQTLDSLIFRDGFE